MSNKNQQRTTKQDMLLNLIKRPEGASAKDLAEVTGWQAHSVRGALSTLKKKGSPIVGEKKDGTTLYVWKEEKAA